MVIEYRIKRLSVLCIVAIIESVLLKLVFLLDGGFDELGHFYHVVLELAGHLQLLEVSLLLAALRVAGFGVVVHGLAHARVHVRLYLHHIQLVFQVVKLFLLIKSFLFGLIIQEVLAIVVVVPHFELFFFAFGIAEHAGHCFAR